MTISAPDQAAQRAYWTAQMDEAAAFMTRVMTHPVVECGEPLVRLDEAAAEAGARVEVSRVPHAQGRPRRHLLRRGLIPGFLQATAAMNRRGWVLRVEDGYRDREMQKFLGRQPVVFDAILRAVVWELGGRTPDPEFLFKRVLTLVAQTPKTGTHMSGSAVDISVLDQVTGEEIDRGGRYLDISAHTPMGSPFLSPAARHNRQAITAIMRDAGFVEYPYEFWHYNGGDAYDRILRGRSEAAIYGAVDWDPRSGGVVPLSDPTQPLNSPDEIAAEVAAALRRLEATTQ